MRQSDRVICRISKIQWNAIRIKGCENQPRNICDHSICICIITRDHNSLSAVFLCYFPHIVGMSLIRCNDAVHIKSHSIRNPSVIFFHAGLLIASCKTQVHRTVDSSAHSAKAGAESMNKPVHFFICGICKKCNIFIVFYIHLWNLFTVPFYLHISLFPSCCMADYSSKQFL